jgi:Sec-independent protein translocase protein TatA
MPQIRQYTAQGDVGGAPQSRRIYTEDISLGRSIQGLGSAISEVSDVVYKRQEQKEVNDLTAKMAAKDAEYTKALQEKLRTADPKDPNYEKLIPEFLDAYDKDIGSLQDGISTNGARQYFTRENAQMRTHFTKFAASAQAELAGIKAVEDYKSTVDNFSATLVSDPSSYERIQQRHDEAIDNMVKYGALPMEKALQFKQVGKETLAKSAVQGWVDINPQYAKKQLEEGQWDNMLGGEAKTQMIGRAEQGINAQRIEAERQKQLEKEALKERQTVVQNDFLAKMSKGKLTTKDILNSNLDAFGSGSKEQFLNMLEQKRDKPMRTDPGTYRALWDRIHLPDGDKKKINDENELNQYVSKGLLTFESLGQLRAEIQGKRTEEGGIESELKKGLADVAKGQLTKSNAMTGLRDPVGDEQYQKFMSYFLTEYSNQRKKGKSAQDLLNPDSPDYLGKAIGRFKRSQQQIMNDMVNSMGDFDEEAKPEATATPAPAALPRQPGESAADYLKRTKAK